METSDSDLLLLYRHHLCSNIPLEMQNVPRWVFALDKVPFNPNAPHEKADATDPSTWADFELAARIAEEHGGFLGFVLGDGFVGVDLDGCRDRETGALNEFANGVIQRLDSYCESSVSGTGIHILCRAGTLPLDSRRRKDIEMYYGDRYFIVTGDRLSGQLRDRTLELKQLHEEMFPEGLSAPKSTTVFHRELMDEAIVQRITSSSNPKLLKLWRGDWSQYPSQSEADIALATLLSSFTTDEAQIGRLVSLSGLQRDKWNRIDYRTSTIRKAFKTAPLSKESISCMSNPNRQNESSRIDGSAIVKLILSLNPELFCSEEGEPYIQVNLGRCNQLLRINSAEFHDAIAGLVYEQSGHTSSQTAIKGASSILSATARQAGQQPLYVRIARIDQNLWLDLGRPDKKVVHVTPTRWQVVSDSPVKFIRPAGMEALPMPQSSAESLLSSLRRLINVASDDGLTLIAGWLVAGLRGKGPYPVLCLNGEQGSAKSSASRMLRRIIDPNQVALSLPPKNDRDLVIRAKSSHVLAYDNISQIPQWLSDAFCSIATKTAFTTRKLYSDDSEAIFSVSRPLVLNGITDFITRDDLLNRTMIVTLDPIPASDRKTESELERLFNELHPGMLARLLDAVVVALQHESHTQVSDCPRLADVAVWVAASESALGMAAGTFVKALNHNQRNSVADNLEGDLLLETIQSLTLPWQGTCKQLRNQMADVEQKPRTDKALGNLLRMKAPALRQMGITFESNRNNGRRLLTLHRTASVIQFPAKQDTHERFGT